MKRQSPKERTLGKARTGGDGRTAAAEVERELTFMIRALEALQRRRNYPLERAEFLILRTLSENGPMNVGALARALLLDDSTMTRQAAALEAKGLVTREPDPADRRAGLVAATAKGEATMRTMLEMRIERVANYLASWPAADRRAVGRLLGRLNAQLAASLSE
jgi:DNA-binding MarR family transcriptional regulator